MAPARQRPSRAMSACQELAVLVTQQTDGKGNGVHKTAIPQLAFMRESEVSTGMCDVTEPILAIMARDPDPGQNGTRGLYALLKATFRSSGGHVSTPVVIFLRNNHYKSSG